MKAATTELYHGRRPRRGKAAVQAAPKSQLPLIQEPSTNGHRRNGRKATTETVHYFITTPKHGRRCAERTNHGVYEGTITPRRNLKALTGGERKVCGRCSKPVRVVVRLETEKDECPAARFNI